MSISSVKPLKKFHLVLWVISALSLVSCLSQKQPTRTETCNVVNKDVQTLEDSTTTLTIEQQAEQLFCSSTESETTLILFDTDKPIDEKTGLPPVKAIATQRVQREEELQENELCQTLSDTRVAKSVIDQSVEESDTAVELNPKAPWWEVFKRRLISVLLVFVSIIALWAMYKLFKIFR